MYCKHQRKWNVVQFPSFYSFVMFYCYDIFLTGDGLSQYEFGITGLVNKRELLQPADQVTFQLDESHRAVLIRAIRKKLIASVDAVKGK